LGGTVFRAGKKEWAFLYIPRSKRSGRKHYVDILKNNTIFMWVYLIIVIFTYVKLDVLKQFNEFAQTGLFSSKNK